MIQHIVMFKFSEEADGRSKEENLKMACDLAGELLPPIETMKGMQVVTNAKDADGTNYDFALICMFDDMEGLNAYQVHPKHVEFGGFIKKVREDRACIDFEVP